MTYGRACIAEGGTAHPRESLAGFFDCGRAEIRPQRTASFFTTIDLALSLGQSPMGLQGLMARLEKVVHPARAPGRYGRYAPGRPA